MLIMLLFKKFESGLTAKKLDISLFNFSPVIPNLLKYSVFQSISIISELCHYQILIMSMFFMLNQNHDKNFEGINCRTMR